MEEELHFLNQNNVWTLVSLPDDKKVYQLVLPIGSGWHFTDKYGADG